MKLSDTLREMRDQFRGHEIVDGQVLISGAALGSLVETLDMAHQAALRLEADLAAARRPRGVVTPFPRHRRRGRIHRDRGGFRTPDDGGDAA